MRAVAACLACGLLAVAVAIDAQNREERRPATPAGTADVHWVKLTFGLDEKPVAWDGGLSLLRGQILETAPWCFEDRDRYDSASHRWFCTTVVVEGRTASSFAEPQRGVLVKLKREPGCELTVETRQGDFTATLDDLDAGRAHLFLDGRASVEILGTSEPLPPAAGDKVAETEDDYPTLAIDARGHRWAAWIGYDDANKRDHLRVLDLDQPGAVVEEITTTREQLHPHLLADPSGRLGLFWAAPEHGNWDLWTSERLDSGWSAPQRLTTAEGTDFHLDVARGRDGSIWLAWQSFRNQNSDVFVKRWAEGRWSNDLPVASTDANEWEPSISVDAQGRAWIGYDSYLNGNYDVYLANASVADNGALMAGPTISIATSLDFEAHAEVEASGDAVWVAYDAAGPNWGKDFTRDQTEFQGRYAEPLHASRRLQLRAVVDGELMEPVVPLPQQLEKLHPDVVAHSNQSEMLRFYELPHLSRDGDGRLWVLFRLNRQGYAGHPKQGANWEFYATTFVGDRWLEPILLPPSKGRQNLDVATAVDSDGRLHAAWSTGDHHVDLPYTIRVGTLPAISGSTADVGVKPLQLDVPEQIVETRPESWTMHAGGERYQVQFGDLHRHTDISLCTPTIDGSLFDTYRYALDAVGHDFLAITDHTRDTDPYPWWRTQKAADLFHIPGVFSPIYAYERSNGIAGGGHRNVFFLERDWPVYRGDAHYTRGRARPDNNDPDVALYPHLRGRKALTAAHTPGYNRRSQKGTWTFHDPQVEPVAELIQTYRRDYLEPGNPQWKASRNPGNLAEEASLWYALARGYKLGFIASSDHHATHTSYACLWATGPDREAVFDALSNRRTYAATDRIILEVRMGEAVMGEEIPAPDVPEISMRVQGTAPIAEIQVVRNRQPIATLTPSTDSFEGSVRDADFPGGAAYYYVRVRQADQNMAWSSPIWVK